MYYYAFAYDILFFCGKFEINELCITLFMNLAYVSSYPL